MVAFPVRITLDILLHLSMRLHTCLMAVLGVLLWLQESARLLEHVDLRKARFCRRAQIWSNFCWPCMNVLLPQRPEYRERYTSFNTSSFQMTTSPGTGGGTGGGPSKRFVIHIHPLNTF